MALNKVLGYKRQPIQGDLLWTQGQKVRKSSKDVKLHAEVAIQDIDTKISTVVSALKSSPSGSLKANVIEGLMQSSELKDKIDKIEKKEVERMNRLGIELEKVLNNPEKSFFVNRYIAGPEGVLEILGRDVAPAYDNTCPIALPEAIVKLVDVSHEAEQYKSKEKKLTSGEAKEFHKYNISTAIGHAWGGRAVKNATEQSMKLDEVADKLDKKELEEFVVNYSGEALYATALLAARETGEVRKIVDFLKGMDVEKAKKYSPFRTYKSGSMSSGPVSQNTKTNSSDDSSEAIQKASEVQNKRAVEQVGVHAKELKKALDLIKDKKDIKLINKANHMSLEFTMFAKSIMAVLGPEDRQAIRMVVEEVNNGFKAKSLNAGLKLKYIPNVKHFDLSVEDEPGFINSWNQYILDLHQKKEPVFLSPDGDALAIRELEDLLKIMNKTTRRNYSVFGALVRDGGVEDIGAPVFGTDESDFDAPTFGV